MNIETYFQEIIREKYNFSPEDEKMYIENALKSEFIKNAFMSLVSEEYSYMLDMGHYTNEDEEDEA